MIKRKSIIRLLAAIISNGYYVGFIKGKIYTGRLKMICLPGLNCYSCPGSFTSCPLGALQAVLSTPGAFFSFYIVGFMLVFGVLFGRLICGLLCPFGLIQDILYKIPFYKKNIPYKSERIYRKIKYIILMLFVVILPVAAVNAAGGGEPWFCKWICPAGTLEGGIPLMLTNAALRQAAGFLFGFKLIILSAILLLSLIIFRPFCKYICPLGGIYGLFNGIALYRNDFCKEKCTDCSLCDRVCLMGLNPRDEGNHPECIRCGRCLDVCKFNAGKRSKIFPEFSKLFKFDRMK